MAYRYKHKLMDVSKVVRTLKEEVTESDSHGPR